MSDLGSIVSFWYDCLKTENALEQSFGLTKKFELTSRTKAMIFSGKADPFIFSRSSIALSSEGEKVRDIANRVVLRGEELYYGYPLLTYMDGATIHVAPLFVIRLELDESSIVAADSVATLGSRAFEQLGLKQEEITALNDEISQVLQDNRQGCLSDVIDILQREVSIEVNETIDPNSLNRNDNMNRISTNMIYNRAVLFTATASPYNLHLLSDLDKLRQKQDLEYTSLSYLTGTEPAKYDASTTPVLPFKYDPYQIKAIQAILANQHTVVSGPPGTGKSQFIANLIINLSVQRKKVLLVSHTGEAVRVVNERIGREFEYLIMQTGKKEIRQSLAERLDKMVKTHNVSQSDADNNVTFEDIKEIWQEIIEKSRYIVETDEIVARILRLQDKISASQRSKSFFLKLLRQFSILRKRIQLRSLQSRTDNEILRDEVEAAQKRHVEISRKYVSSNYLKSIFSQGGYGELVAYIESVQSRKPLYGAPDPAERYIDSALNSINVWSSTLKSIGANFPLQANLFDYVIFDEASQIDLPSAAPALYRAKNVVVVGDAQQLTHITNINEEVEVALAKTHNVYNKRYYPGLVSYRGTSLFSSAKHALQDTEQVLSNHYRSNYAIARLFNDVFYGSGLNIFEPDEYLPSSIKSGAYWSDVQGTATKSASGSRYNNEEVDRIVDLLRKLLPISNENNLTIGIATPYSRQKILLSNIIEATFGLDTIKNVRVLTVHQFQGSEVDILLFSTVVASEGNGNSVSWYRMNPQILNVAISRAKQLLVIVGDRSYAIQSKTKLKNIAELITNPTIDKAVIRPMNIFEYELYNYLQESNIGSYDIRPQFVVDGRYTIDFGLFSTNGDRIAVELDGIQHVMVGQIAIFDDVRRDKYLQKTGWKIIRIPLKVLLTDKNSIYDLINNSVVRLD